MITDKSSEAYKIAKDLAEHWLKHKNEQVLAQTFEAKTATMKRWEILAVKDTFQALLKEAA